MSLSKSYALKVKLQYRTLKAHFSAAYRALRDYRETCTHDYKDWIFRGVKDEASDYEYRECRLCEAMEMRDCPKNVQL